MFSHPQYVSRPETSRGRDPLGLQSTVMALYRQVYPGLNNRARYIRVYSAICWMVQQTWDYLGDEPSEDDIQDAFDAGMPKIQLMLVWANARARVRALPGLTRHWPEDGVAGNLTYREMPTPAGNYANDAESEDIDDDEAGGSDGTTFLGPDEYGPSITNGLQFVERWPGYRNVLELTEGGEALAEAFEKLLTRKYPKAVEWFRDPYSASITSGELDALWEVLRLDKPTAAEQQAFAAQLYPELPAARLAEDFRQRRDGLTLALRAIAAEEDANEVPGGYVDVERIRHTMARGFATNGAALDLTDLERTQRAWKSLQIRKYLKVALETLFRSCEARIHHAMVKSFSRDASGKPVVVSRTLEAIAQQVGELAQSCLRTAAPTVADLLNVFIAAQGAAPSLYFAALDQPDLDLYRNMKGMERDARFQLSSDADSSEGDAVASALGALLWCAVEAKHVPEESLVEDGDRLPLTILQELVERFRYAPPCEFVAEVVNNHVLNLHFAVVCERCNEDYDAGRAVKDRYRILVGDEGLERNQAGGQLLTSAEEMRDILLHALYLLSQSGFVTQHPDRWLSFRLTDAGWERAMRDLKALDSSMDENSLVLI
ncbi:hypothetical protein [Burkholderia stagnalis]|uniref:hypothetical protein n=1 Tax=Burkholderia stagnalis TaxID=1503054 RepID=UPI00076DEE34|nr:hypothetical protein [Burkholderia stagnalis]KWH44381.1 hypothetical protein WT61_29780 [Burkholderia stagnalis]